MCSPYHLDMYECIAACVCMRASHGQSFDKFHTETDTKVANQPNGCPTAFAAATFEMAIVDSFVDWHCKSGRCLLARLPIVLLFFFSFILFLVSIHLYLPKVTTAQTKRTIQLNCVYICMNNLYADKFK